MQPYLRKIKSDKVAHVLRKAIKRGIILGSMNANPDFLKEIQDVFIRKICSPESKEIFEDLLTPECDISLLEDEKFSEVSKIFGHAWLISG